jgi:hypothetical protein
MKHEPTSKTSNITKIQWNMCENHKTMCLCKIHGFRNVEMAQMFFNKNVMMCLFYLWCLDVKYIRFTF